MASTDSQQQLAYQSIKRKLLAGGFPPGRRLSRRKLAAAIGVSAPSVQHVLGQLANEGLVEVRPQSGTYPRILSAAEFEELAVLRRLLEPYAAEQAAMTATATQVATLQAAAAEMARLAEQVPTSADPVGDFLDELYQQERRFHTTVWRAANNTLVAATLENLHILAVAAMRAHAQAERFCRASAGSAAEHAAVAAAIAARTPDAAREAMAHHLRPNPWGPDEALPATIKRSKRKAARP